MQGLGANRGGRGTGQILACGIFLGGPDSIPDVIQLRVVTWILVLLGFSCLQKAAVEKGLDPALSVFWMRSFALSLVSVT